MHPPLSINSALDGALQVESRSRLLSLQSARASASKPWSKTFRVLCVRCVEETRRASFAYDGSAREHRWQRPAGGEELRGSDLDGVDDGHCGKGGARPDRRLQVVDGH